jgi:hypothetical protein
MPKTNSKRKALTVEQTLTRLHAERVAAEKQADVLSAVEGIFQETLRSGLSIRTVTASWVKEIKSKAVQKRIWDAVAAQHAKRQRQHRWAGRWE